MDWQNLLTIKIINWSISILVGPAMVVVLTLGIVVLIFAKRKFRDLLPHSWKVETANIKLGGMGTVSIKPDVEDMQIAHKAWVELTTRKAGIPFDPEHDVVTEIYDSWYRLFSEMRELAKQIPADKIRSSKDTQELVRLLVDALNSGLRPHLTKWQARFRRWYSKQVLSHHNKFPQEIQKLYPKYDELVEELKLVNKQMVEYTGFIKKVAHGE